MLPLDQINLLLQYIRGQRPFGTDVILAGAEVLKFALETVGGLLPKGAAGDDEGVDRSRVEKALESWASTAKGAGLEANGEYAALVIKYILKVLFASLV